MALRWQPIEDLPPNWEELRSLELTPLASVWHDQEQQLRETTAYREFMNRMRREIAIETGIIERLYTIDRGITQILIEHGIHEALIPHGKTDRPVAEIVAIIRDQEEAVESLFDFVARRRDLSTSYIKELHSLLTRHQLTTDALGASTNEIIEVPLLRGDWKRLPNNPTRRDGTTHEYCPPEHVASEMDHLISLHHDHVSRGVPPEVEAAWLHHRFTQIHPFQDGNGRVARCLASLVFLQAGWFPLSITDDDRSRYIDALERADEHNIIPLIGMFSEREKQAFVRSLSLSEQVLTNVRQTNQILESVRSRLEAQARATLTERVMVTETYANRLFDVALPRLNRLSQELRTSLGRSAPQLNCYVAFARHGDPRAAYHQIQITEGAKQMSYFANRQGYSSWLQIVIAMSTRVDILLSFHEIGRENKGVFACSAVAYHKDPDEEGTSLVTQVQALSESPFQFSYKDTEQELDIRFREWLDEVLLNGLNYWQLGI